MTIEESPEVFDRIKDIEIDLVKYKEKDKEGFMIESSHTYHYVKTIRYDEAHTHHYSTFVLNPCNMFSALETSKNSFSLEQALKNHFGILEYLKHRGSEQ